MLSLAALFAPWSTQSVRNPTPLPPSNPRGPNLNLNVAERVNTLFTVEVCQYQYGAGDVPYDLWPLQCAQYAWSTYLNSRFAPVREFNYGAFAPLQLRSAITVSAAFGVIGTAAACLGALVSALALGSDAFAGPEGGAVASATRLGARLNVLSAGAWVISWAVFIWFESLNVSAINSLYVGAGNAGSPPLPGAKSRFTAGFALAVIVSGLSLVAAAAAFWTSLSAPPAAPAAAAGPSARTGRRFAWAAVLGVAAAATAVGAMVSPWLDQTVRITSRMGLRYHLSAGLYEVQVCSVLFGDAATAN